MPLAQAVEGVWEQRWWWPALEKEEGRRVRKIEVVAQGLGQLQGNRER